MPETLASSEATTISAAELFGSAEEKPASEAKPQGETVENSEAQTEETEADEAAQESKEESDGEESDESEGQKDDAEDDDEGDEPQKEEKQKGVGKRISKLVKQKQALKQELEYYKQQVMNAQSKNPESGSQARSGESESAEPRAEDFENYEEYQKALFRYSVRQELNPALDEIKKTITAPKTEAEADKVQKAFDKRNKAFAKEHKDYAETLQSLNGIDVDKSVEQAIVLSEHGPAVLYELGKNPDLAEEIAELPPHLQLKEIGKLEARIEARIEARKNAPPKTTKAPPPPNPVGSKSEGRKSVSDPGLSTLDFFKLRNEEEKKRRDDFF